MPKAVIVVAPRPDFPGFWSAQKFWPSGATTVDVVDQQVDPRDPSKLLPLADGQISPAQLTALQADQAAGLPLGVQQLPDAPVAPAAPAPVDTPAPDAQTSAPSSSSSKGRGR